MGDAEDIRFCNGSAAFDQVLETGRLHQLHRNVEVALVVAYGIHFDHIWVLDRCRKFCLTLEHGGEGFIFTEVLVQDLQRHFPPEGLINGAKNLRHSAFAEKSGDLVMSKQCPNPDGFRAVRALDF